MDGNGASGDVRSTWTLDEVLALLACPFSDLVHRAQVVHRRHFDPNAVQVSTLLSIKTGGCPEDCAYCPQSIRYDTGLEREALLPPATCVARARAAREARRDALLHGRRVAEPEGPRPRAGRRDGRGRQRARPRDLRDARHADAAQAERLQDAGLDYYNHNLDTSEAYYGEVITTRTYEDRLETLAHVRDAGIKVCCGGIVGMGETADDRAALLHTLATLDPHPRACRSTPRAGRGHAARRARPRSIRSSSCAPSRSRAS